MRLAGNVLRALVVVLVVLGMPATPAAASAPAGVQAALDEMVEQGSPGVALSYRGPRGSWALTSGVADLDSRRPMPAYANWRIASVTKSLVAVVVMQLAREGRLRLSDHVGAATVRDLLRHTSGIYNYTSDPAYQDPELWKDRTFRPADLVAIADQHPATPPGGPWAYSNTNYVLLGMLIEKITGHTLSAEVRRRVLIPAGMTSTYLPTSFPHILGPHATGYYWSGNAHPDDPDPHLVPLTVLNPSFYWADANAISNAHDVTLFWRALFGGRLLPASYVQQMTTAIPTGDPVFDLYGLGLESMKLSCGVRLWGHTGAVQGFGTQTWSTPDGAQQIVLSSNQSIFGERLLPILYAAVDSIDRGFCR